MNQHYNKLGFKIPQNYFKESKDQIINSLNTKEKSSTIKRNIKRITEDNPGVFDDFLVLLEL